MEKTDFIKLLSSRLFLAKKFCEKWQKKVKKWLKHYNIESLEDVSTDDLHNKIQIPYIFSTVESGLPSIFNQFPKLVIKGRGKDDQEFGNFVDNVWEYIYDRTGLESVVDKAGIMFLISGIGQARRGWITDTETVEEEEEVEIKNDDGTPVLDEAGNPVTQKIIKKVEVPIVDMPFVEWVDYRKLYYSPESQFVVSDEQNFIPYVIYEHKMMPEEVEARFGKKIDTANIKSFLDLSEIDRNLEVDDKNLEKEDLKRVVVYEYQGVLPKEHAQDKAWKWNRVYRVFFTKDEILSKKPEKIPKKEFYQFDNYGTPVEFFKFGEPKILWDLEKDVSIGHSTILDYRDRFATKIWLDNTNEVDEQSLRSPKKFTIVKGTAGKNPPQYISPPPLPETILIALNQSKEDISMTSAQLDIGRGGTTSTVDTATGQKIFQEAQDRRIARKRKKIAYFIQILAKDLLADVAVKWDLETFAKIVDMDVNDQKLADFVERLKNIGQDWDIEIEPESVISNKETIGAQAIAMYREMKDDPMVNKAELIKEAIRTGFSRKNVDQYLSQELTPEQLVKALEMFVQAGIVAPERAQEIVPLIQGQEQPQQEGRPPIKSPTEIVKEGMVGTDKTQINAQNQAAYKQVGVPKVQRK